MESAKLRVHRSLRATHHSRKSYSASTSPAPGFEVAKLQSPTGPGTGKLLLSESSALKLTPEPTSEPVVDKKSIPKSFRAKKEGILKALAVPEGEYSDRSPKGSVDEGVKDVLELVNRFEGWVSTSSCAGRVSVFVEGGKGRGEDEEEADGVDDDLQRRLSRKDDFEEAVRSELRSGPAGKGGGKWLYVSHDPIPTPPASEDSTFTKLFGLEPMGSGTSGIGTPTGKTPRLVHLSFSPLILHILGATLHHAKPLLPAAINAGFRESGVQSLRALDDPETGPMLGIRTNGLLFDTIIGMVVEDDNGKERFQSIVSEEYLQMCMRVINERFEWNTKRKERLIDEIKNAVDSLTKGEEESKEERRERKRADGLRRQQERRLDLNDEKEDGHEDVLQDGLRTLDIR
jgi:tRNA wybutosine-synthesizing protein 3